MFWSYNALPLPSTYYILITTSPETFPEAFQEVSLGLWQQSDISLLLFSTVLL